MKSIRTYHPRRGRLSGRHHDALDRLLPAYGADAHRPVTARELFGVDVPLVVEIGSGMGEATAAMAQADPARGYLAVEIHTPGVANLLATVEERGLTNVRVAFEDAMELMGRVPHGTLAAVHAFFPDPWPKARHHKRRLIQPGHVAVLASRLVPGGLLWCATDWPGYAESMEETLDASPLLIRMTSSASEGAHVRPLTKFEKRGHDAGRAIADLRYTRR
ncbi:tRNA (guanosine(46)-N7)-methyltransferase TrmB [Virgisporangium ochraceum]|uniref:tRNA (guanine-N(7)-)-methyltransferase n=1 Tax=Virgisporangium ochraceum TaxID=65505 RepID=A0A8J3ZQH6_9ACTN|nr:tRNA (guanosine(46)-N7)-methyltransferase TrmB [Virgisporangium ochraceum]GIJ68584.1 tRNA (guanine-N(7)-)-methyltransferase [Virgisporangium ochraceum]